MSRCRVPDASDTRKYNRVETFITYFTIAFIANCRVTGRGMGGRGSEAYCNAVRARAVNVRCNNNWEIKLIKVRFLVGLNGSNFTNFGITCRV